MGDVIAATTRVIDRSARLALPIDIRKAMFGDVDDPGIGERVRITVKDGTLVIKPVSKK